MFASVVVALFGVFYTPGGEPSPRAALLSVLGGCITRVVLEFALEKDGYLLLPFEIDEFLNYGPAASANFPVFFDLEPDLVWNPDDEPCVQERFRDFTGVDSLAAPLCALILYVGIQALENSMGKPLFSHPALEPYEKDLGHDDIKDETEMVKDPQKDESGESSDDKKDEKDETADA